jgi:midasin
MCLSGPVGCVKTTLVDYLAPMTPRVAQKVKKFVEFTQSEQPKVKVKSNKRKLRSSESKTDDENITEEILQSASKNGFLRVQLGDQTVMIAKFFLVNIDALTFLTNSYGNLNAS